MKKLILIILTLSLIISSVPLNSFAQSTDTMSALDFMKTLGVMRKNIYEEDILTRAELARIYYSIVLGNFAEKDSVSRFSDVEAKDAQVVEFACDLKIMNGESTEIFNPDGNVTYAQFSASLIRFLGYEQYAVLSGGYPHGYTTQMSILKIAPSPVPPDDAYVTCKGAAEMLKSALNAELMREIQEADGSIKYEVKEDSDWLSEYKDIRRSVGIVTGAGTVNLLGEAPIEKGFVKFENRTVELGDLAANLKNLIGHSVDIYYKEEGNKYIAVYYEENNNDVLYIDGGKIISYQNGRLWYEDGKSDKKASIDGSAYIVYNGSVCENYTDDIFNVFASGKLDGGITLIDNDDSGSYDIVSISAGTSYVVEKVIDGVIYNKYHGEKVIDLNDYDEDSLLIVNVAGQRLRFDDIAKGDILSVEENKEGKYTKITVTIDQYTGVLTAYEKDDTNVRLEIDGTSFECSNSLMTNPQLGSLKLGQTVCAYFNKNGEISDIEYETYDKYDISYLVDVAAPKGLGNEEWLVKLLDSDGVIRIYTLADRVFYYGKKTYDAEEIIPFFGTVESGKVKRQVIRFKTNPEGKISAVDLIDYALFEGATEDSDFTRDGLFMFPGYDGTMAPTHRFRETASTFGGYMIIGGQTIYFIVPPENERNNDDGYGIGSWTSYFETNVIPKKPFVAVGNGEGNPFVYAFVFEDSISGNKEVDPYTYSFLVENATEVIYEEEEMVKLTGYCLGAYCEWYAEEGILNVKDGKLPEAGDVIRADRNSFGEIVCAEFVFDGKTRRFGGDFSGNPSGHLNNLPFFGYGKVVYNDGMCITVEYTDPTTYEVVRCNYTLPRFECKYKFDPDGRKAKTNVIDASEVLGENNYPGNGSMVFVHTGYMDHRTIIVYKGE